MMRREQSLISKKSHRSPTLPVVTQRRVIVHGFYSESESPSDDDTEKDARRSEPIETGVVSIEKREYWDILKAVKFLQNGPPSACFTALSYIIGCDFNNKWNSSIFLTGNRLETLVNLTEVKYPQIVIAALTALRNISNETKLVPKLIDLGLCYNLVECLGNKNHQYNSMSCEVIANIGCSRLAARNIRKWDGIKKIVALLNVEKRTLIAPESTLSEEEKSKVHVANCAARALCSLSKFTKNKKEVLNAGVIPIMTELILSGNRNVSIPMTGMLCECSSEFLFQLAIANGLVGVLLQDMMSKDRNTNYLCANALANAADHHEMVRHTIRHCGGLRMVMEMLESADRFNTPLVTALLRLIWRSSIALENVKEYHSLKAIDTIFEFMASREVKLQIAVTGIVSEFAKYEPCRERLTSLGVIDTLINNFVSSNTTVLCNTIRAIGNLVKNAQAMQIVQQSDLICRIWSLLKNEHVEVQVEAMDSLLPIVQEAKDSAELIRILDGSLQLLVHTLNHGNEELIGGACLLIAEVAKDQENLMVMTDYGVVKVLSFLVKKEEEVLREANERMESRDVKDMLQQYGNLDTFVDDDPEGVRRALAKAIAMCSTTSANAIAFGEEGVIASLVLFLKSKKPELRGEASHALWELSRFEVNCVQIHLCGAVDPLLHIVGQNDQLAQISAAGTLSNLRRILEANDLRRHCVYHNRPLFAREEIPVK